MTCVRDINVPLQLMEKNRKKLANFRVGEIVMIGYSDVVQLWDEKNKIFSEPSNHSKRGVRTAKIVYISPYFITIEYLGLSVEMGNGELSAIGSWRESFSLNQLDNFFKIKEAA